MNRARLQQATVRVLPYQDLIRMTPMLLSPVAVLAALMAAWRYGVDAGWTDSFAVTDGLFSHWQVWLGLAVAIQWASHRLDGLAKRN